MTIDGLVWAWEQKGLEPVEKLVLLALGDVSSDHAPPPNLAAVAERSDISRDELDPILERLRDQRFIDDENRTLKR